MFKNIWNADRGGELLRLVRRCAKGGDKWAAMGIHNLRRWRSPDRSWQFYTCARPGRSKGKARQVEDKTVHEWIRSLPGEANTVIVSLLGRKNGPAGKSEFSFYPSFYGDWDEPQERHGKMSFQRWLDRHHKDRGIRVVEFPTYDGIRVPEATLRAVECEIFRLLSEGRTVVLMDSGGIERTRQVCVHMGFVENTGLVENGPAKCLKHA